MVIIIFWGENQEMGNIKLNNLNIKVNLLPGLRFYLKLLITRD